MYPRLLQNQLKMKKQLLLFSSILMLSQLEILSQNGLQKAPANPDFLNYLKTANGNPGANGFIPSPIMPVKSAGKTISNPGVSALPASYDMRKLGLVTPIKDQLNQGPCGSCWTHSCMSCIETLNLKLDNTSYNFSEDNLNNCHAPFDNLPCKGGSFYMSSAYLLAGKGPLLESQDPYMGPKDNSCPVGVLKPAEYITDAWMIPINDMNTIKQAMMNYGALDVSFYWTFNAIRTSDSTFFFNKPYTFSTPTANIDTSGFGQWHAVSLIGWDDNRVTAAAQKGAWLIKNSIVKSSFADLTQSAGYLYVSYYDSVAWQDIGCWPKKIAYDSTAQLHHYDDGGWVSSFGYNDNNADYGLIKFVAGVDEQLKFLTTVAVHPNTTVSFDVYDNFNGTTLSGLLGSITNQTCTFAGYNSFNLTTPITILKGNDFYIKVKYNCPTDYTYLVPIEEIYGGYTTNAVIETGKCWVSGNGTSWAAIGTGTGSPYDICIKAYATALKTTSVKELNATLVNKIYPNPASATLNIELMDNSKKTITLKNLQGQILSTTQVNALVTSVDVSTLSTGIYFISVQSENGIQTMKFIREE